LQKEVSKIFTGIQIPKKGAPGTDARATAPIPPIIPPARVAPAPTPAPVTPPAPVVHPAPLTSSEPAAIPESVIIPEPVIIPPASVTPAIPKPVPAPVAAAPASVVPAPVTTTPKTVTPAAKSAGVSPKPFTIPEPPAQTASQQPRQAVYEPPKPRQPLAIAPETTSAPVKQAKTEVIIKHPSDSPILKIVGKIKAKLFDAAKGPEARRQKLMILLSPVLVIVLLLVVVNAVKKSPNTSAKPSKKATAVALAFDGKINWELPQPIPANLRNPMLFRSVSVQGKETTEGPVVKGIVYSEDNPCAVVGDRIVSAGDTVAGATVIKINPDSVDFAMGDKKWTQKVER
jgi:hypothetical protein